MNPTLLSPDQKRTILAKKFPRVIRCEVFRTKTYWAFFDGKDWCICHRNDPLLDANAAQAMEGTLTEEQWEDYCDYLLWYDDPKGAHSNYASVKVGCFATPAQRFDAFLSLLPEE